MDYRDGPSAPPADDEPETRAAPVSAHEHGQRLDKVLALRVPEFSRTWMQALIERGHVREEGLHPE